MWSFKFSAWLTFLFLLVVAAGTQLIGPSVPDDRQADNCVQNLRFNGYFGVSLSCDSPMFVWLTSHPQHLMDRDSFRQARPGIVHITYLLEKPIKLFVRGIDMPEPQLRAGGEMFLGEQWTKRTSVFLAYFVFNIMILIATFWLLLDVIDPLAPEGILAGIGTGAIASLLAANEVTKMFLWSPHTQLFNIFVPVFTIWAVLAVLRHELTRRLAVGIGLTIGIGMLVYQVFPIAFASVFTAVLFRLSRKSAINLAIFTACSIAPYLIWYAIVRLKSGGFYHAEFHTYNQVGWMLDAWRAGELFSRLAGSLWLMIKLAFHQSYVAIVMLIVVAALGLPEPGKRTYLLHLTLVSVFVSVAAGAFFATVGLTISRIAFIMVAPLLILVAAVYATSSPIVRPRMHSAAVLALLALAIVNISEVAFHRKVWF